MTKPRYADDLETPMLLRSLRRRLKGDERALDLVDILDERLYLTRRALEASEHGAERALRRLERLEVRVGKETATVQELAHALSGSRSVERRPERTARSSTCSSSYRRR